MRAVFAVLADPLHRLPIPGVAGAIFPASGRRIDADDTFWSACLADGSLVEAPDPGEGTAPLPPVADDTADH